MEQRRILLAELPNPLQVKSLTLEGIEKYDIDNAYPTRMERLINGSITAKSSARILTRFLIGQGFTDPLLNKIEVAKDRYQRPITAYKLLRQIALSTAYYSGYYVRAQFDANHNVTGLLHEDFKNCRFGLKDSDNYSGKVVIYDNWDRSKGTKMNKKQFITVDVWNMNKKVIESQIAKSKGIEKYRGQMFFLFMDEYYIYPLAPIDPVMFDADTENQISKFKNGELRRGFFMKKMIHHNRFDSQPQAEDFKDKLLEFQGGGHEFSFMLLEGTFNDDGTLKDSENIKIENVEQNINDKIFETYEKSCINNIRKAYNAIPQILIDYEDGKLGTTSGEALRQAAEFYNQMTVEFRDVITESFVEMFSNWTDPALRTKTWEILPLVLGSAATETGGELSLKIPLEKTK